MELSKLKKKHLKKALANMAIQMSFKDIQHLISVDADTSLCFYYSLSKEGYDYWTELDIKYK